MRAVFNLREHMQVSKKIYVEMFAHVAETHYDVTSILKVHYSLVGLLIC